MTCEHISNQPLPPFYVVDNGYGVRIPIGPNADLPPGTPVRPSQPIAWVPPWDREYVNGGLPATPGHPDTGLPPSPGHPGNALPPVHGHVDNGLPWVPGHADNGLPPVHGHADNDLPWVPGRPDAGLPPVQGLPDNSLPGISWPVDPGYGTDAPAPGQPDNTLPSPSPAFTAMERAHIRALATAKFINTPMTPMRCLVQAARFVMLMRQRIPTTPVAQPK